MEYIEGTPLTGPLPPDEAVPLGIADRVDALETAHTAWASSIEI